MVFGSGHDRLSYAKKEEHYGTHIGAGGSEEIVKFNIKK